jgi:hypothetical protein
MLDGTGIRGLAGADAVVVAVTSSSGAATCHISAEQMCEMKRINKVVSRAHM